MLSLMSATSIKIRISIWVIIFKEGIAVDLEKIVVITEWPTPKNMLDVRSFMELDGYYQRFMKGFSQIPHPITSLQWKNTKSI